MISALIYNFGIIFSASEIAPLLKTRIKGTDEEQHDTPELGSYEQAINTTFIIAEVIILPLQILTVSLPQRAYCSFKIQLILKNLAGCKQNTLYFPLSWYFDFFFLQNTETFLA